MADDAGNAAPAVAPAYGAGNKLVSADRAAELRARLMDKLKNQTSADIDPEILAIGAELAVFHIEAGARRFIDLARAISGDLGTTPARLKPYLRSWYNGARAMMEDSDVSVEGMDSAETVRTILQSGAIDGLAAGPLPQQAPSVTIAPAAAENGDGNRPRAGGDQGNAGSQPEDVSQDVGSGQGGAGGAANLRAGEGAVQPDPAGTDSGLDGAAGNGGGAGQGRGDRDGFGGNRPRNYRISPGGLNDTRGEKTRAKDSVEAIRLLKKIESRNRRATPEEQAKLALYAGAGSLNPAVQNSDGSVRAGWESLAADLSSLVSEEEMETIAGTTQYAFYTSEEVVRAMWGAVRRLGFNGGTVFEPGMGVGTSSACRLTICRAR